MTKTKIEWTDKVWNPVTGCTKVSQGCKNCYAETIAKRFWGERKFSDVQCHMDRLEQPLHWRKPSRVFVNSMSDLFHEDVPDGFIDEVFNTMAICNHTFQILTKRPKRMMEYIHRIIKKHGETWFEVVWDNVWLIVSVEDQKSANERIPLLLQTPAAVRGVSCEPLLGWLDLGNFICDTYSKGGLTLGRYLDWVIVGGESGPHARPMHPDWARSIRDQCQAAEVPYFFKQFGEWTTDFPQSMSLANRKQTYLDGTTFYRVGKSAAGRMLDGRTWDEFPEVE